MSGAVAVARHFIEPQPDADHYDAALLAAVAARRAGLRSPPSHLRSSSATSLRDAAARPGGSCGGSFSGVLTPAAAPADAGAVCSSNDGRAPPTDGGDVGVHRRKKQRRHAAPPPFAEVTLQAGCIAPELASCGQPRASVGVGAGAAAATAGPEEDDGDVVMAVSPPHTVSLPVAAPQPAAAAAPWVWPSGGVVLTTAPPATTTSAIRRGILRSSQQHRPPPPRRVSFAASAKAHCGLAPASRAFEQLVSRFFASRLGAAVPFPVPELPPLPGASLPVLVAQVAAGPSAGAIAAALAAYAPPAAVIPAATVVLSDPALGGGCPRQLRSLLHLAEGLHVRLLEALLRDRMGVRDDDDDCEGGGAAAGENSVSDGRAGDASAFFDRVEDDLSDEEGEALDGHAAEMARRAGAAAQAYASKRREPAAPVLPGGGGSCAKLGAAHLTWVQQLVMLVRHAILAAPPATD